jgi:hypothetical protein
MHLALTPVIFALRLDAEIPPKARKRTKKLTNEGKHGIIKAIARAREVHF